MKRYLDDLIARDLSKKMVFVTGPRQVGKTTLSRMLLDSAPGQYLNYDVADDRAVILNAKWNPQASLLVLDEIHKMPDWKPWLKGVFDGKPAKQQLLVTGSARLGQVSAGGRITGGAVFCMAIASDFNARMVHADRGHTRRCVHAFAHARRVSRALFGDKRR